MKRLVIITVGKTHSGKTTFAKALEQQLHHSLVIDQDNHAEFINTYYKPLLPKQGPNAIKYTITQSIVSYAVQQTNLHLILCNSNRSRKDRLELLSYFQRNGFTSILVNFDIPDPILQERVIKSQRSTAIFRFVSNFEEVLTRQQAETDKEDIKAPLIDEADHLFVIKKEPEVQSVIQRIVTLEANV
ncbi:AAA family ATPase [Agaribacter marinus]|uniref:ATP-binding protein n=1 Tax=Virgibacillus salarius TaxID=447199 RepID=A0A941DWM3_9BACI|nr:ATP-binding protein [Virgibacillus salarius]MBR7798155.1 ATP-binding protein [Virgibacillus salarius]NAZ10863.1 AAA family ATPase [Agaribacter marinus]